MRYEIQYGSGGECRITDTRDDSRVATCWDQFNALLVTSALNTSPPELSLSFGQLRGANVRRCEEVFHKLSDWNPLEWAGAMCGEAGEAANIAKKIKRLEIADAAKDTVEERERLAAMLIVELADVVTYCDLLAAAIGKDLGSAVKAKFNAVSEERGSKERL